MQKQAPEPIPLSDTLLTLLSRFWGYTAFRPYQEAIIKDACRGQHTLGVLPTGAGKSLCFQLAGLYRGGLTLVISPLIALMEDQVAQLNARGIKATFINSTLPQQEIDQRLYLARQGKVRLLYLAPERLGLEALRYQAPLLNIHLLAVDEAHCISQWGYDFRPAYLQIKDFHDLIPQVPIMALTASATPKVRADILSLLGIPGAGVHLQSFARHNLRYAVLYETDRHTKLLGMLQAVQGSTILYVRTRRATADLVHFLQEHNIAATDYHAGLTPAQRQKAQADWMTGNTRIIVATNAFGMGIDKPDVRLVLHWHLPPDLESYYQEAGRAGRDGRTAFAAILYSSKDAERLTRQQAERYPTLQEVRAVYAYLADSFRLPQPNHLMNAEPAELNTRHPIALDDWAAKLNLPPATLASALQLLARAGILLLHTPERGMAQLRFIAPGAQVLDYKTRAKPQISALINHALRSLGGLVYRQMLPFDPKAWARALDVTPQALDGDLCLLAGRQIINYQPATALQYFQFATARLLADQLNEAKLGWAVRSELQAGSGVRLAAMLHYAGQRDRCRSQLILEYFGETGAEPCGRCDVCTGRHHTQAAKEILVQIKQEISMLLSDQPLNYGEVLLSLKTGLAEQRVRVLRQMLELEEVVERKGGSLYLNKQ